MSTTHHGNLAWAALLTIAIALAPSSPLSVSAAAIPSFQDLGGLSPTEMSCEVGFAGLSNDGQVVVGQCNTTRGFKAFRWSEEDGMRYIPNLRPEAGYSNRANAVSADGSVVVGRGFNSSGNSEAYRWTAATGTVGLGDLPGGAFFSEAWGVSDDGGVVLGTSTVAGVVNEYNQAFRWTTEEGMTALPYSTPGDDFGLANVISSDGAVIAGHSVRNLTDPFSFHATRWVGGDTVEPLVEPSGYPYSNALAISADGAAIVGWAAHLEPETYAAYRWTESGGMVILGDLPGGSTSSLAKGISDDGTVVVGWELDVTDSGTRPTRAFVWDEAHGMRDLRVVLQEEYGLDLTGWTLQAARGISGDGMVVAGTGYHADNPARSVPWRVVLGTPGDTNLDGAIDLEDLNAVRNHFGEGVLGGARIAGDTAPFDGLVDLADLNRVRNHFGAGTAAVPEPGTLVLALGVCTGVVLTRGRRRRRQS